MAKKQATNKTTKTTATKQPTVAQLKTQAKQLGVTGYAKMKRDDLEAAIAAAQPQTKKATKTAKPKAPKAPGVSMKKGRCYVAGAAIANAGLPAGVTKEMEQQLATALGRDPIAQDGFDLRQAWQAIRGYLDALGMETELPTVPTE